MICTICGGTVIWKGPITALTHTECQNCGAINCQMVEPEPDEDTMSTEPTYTWTAWENPFPPEHEGHHDRYLSSTLLVDGEPKGHVMCGGYGTVSAYPIKGGHWSHLDYEDTAKAIVEKAAGRDVEIPMGKLELLRLMAEAPRALSERDARVLADIANEAQEGSAAMRSLLREREERYSKARERIEQLRAMAGGIIVTNGQRNRYRMWGDTGPEWTDNPDAALKFADRASAEAFARDDEDAWCIVPLGELV